MKWDLKTLDQIGTISRGRSKHRPRDDKRLFGGKYPFIQTSEVKNANLYLKDYSETYSEFGLSQSKLWSSGTLCITIAANIADTAILGIDACFPDSIMGFIPFENVSDVRFVKYTFDLFQRDCKQISQGTAQDNLSWQKLSTIKFPIPPYEVQCRIADILSTYDNLIENNYKQIKLLEESAQRLYKEWFIDFRFPGCENTKFIDGIPEGWKNILMKDIVDLKSGYAFKSSTFDEKGKYKIVTIKNVQDGYFERKNISTIVETPAKMPKHCILKDGDILLSLTGNVGRTCLVFGENFLLNQRVAKLESKYQGFVYCHFRNQTTYSDLCNLANGAAQQNLSPIRVGEMRINVATKDILDDFEELIKPLISKILILNKDIYMAEQARDLLLPKLMSGEIEV